MRIVALLILFFCAGCAPKIIVIEIRNHLDEELNIELCFDPESFRLKDTTKDAWSVYINNAEEKKGKNNPNRLVQFDSIRTNYGYLTLKPKQKMILPMPYMTMMELNKEIESVKVSNSNFYMEAKGRAFFLMFELSNKGTTDGSPRDLYLLEVKDDPKYSVLFKNVTTDYSKKKIHGGNIIKHLIRKKVFMLKKSMIQRMDFR